MKSLLAALLTLASIQASFCAEINPAELLDSAAGRVLLRDLGLAPDEILEMAAGEREEILRSVRELEVRAARTPDLRLAAQAEIRENPWLSSRLQQPAVGFEASRAAFLANTPRMVFECTDPALGDAPRRLMQPVADTIDGWLRAAGLKAPDGVHFTVSESKLKANVLAPGRIEVPYFSASAEELIYTRVIFAHEYVHAVFELNSGLSFAWARDFKDAQILAEETRLAWKGLEAAAAPAETIEAAEKEWSAATDRLARIKNVVTAYSELLSDFAAVLLTGDGQAVEKADRFLSDGTMPPDIASPRDFTVHRELAGWDYEGPYVLLDPTKEYLWQRGLANPAYRGRQSELFKRLFDAIGGEIQARLSQPALENLKPAEINARLMRRIGL